jgi:hypothetical protein
MREVLTVCRSIFGALVITVLFSVAAQQATAQEPMPTVNQNGPVAGGPAQQPQASPPANPNVIKPPTYCQPCLYYSGDFNPTGANPDGLANENDVVVSLSQIYTPFVVPSGKKWHVQRLFVNSLAVTGTQDPLTTGWSIWTNVASGQPGTLVAAGAGKGKITPTGRTFAGYTEYTTSVKAAVTLPCGTYWVNVMPQCTNDSDTDCTGQRVFESDVTDASPAEHYGSANVLGESFIFSNLFGYDWSPTTSNGSYFTLFSFGVKGNAAHGPICM